VVAAPAGIAQSVVMAATASRLASHVTLCISIIYLSSENTPMYRVSK
jgi:hypothetical protein